MKREEQRKRHLYTVDSSHERGEEYRKRRETKQTDRGRQRRREEENDVET